ncbi:DUF6308 family protein [Nocardioides zeae]|uniref:DUF6308 family protein n=1 Tax=Nocardioides imazamoxiresistens TaxID=3231893 RepID=A0ABU3PQW2_9ACTN|nr:DUF6308 family protein [Nocardioides zeae]MDT9591602.1 DUF6308 family protein [Nocardioides zeae]
MSELGEYGDGRTFQLPQGWRKARAEVVEMALRQTMDALAAPRAAERLTAYYDPQGNYSGLLFAEVGENQVASVTPADLWAVATLSIEVNSRQARMIFGTASARIGSLLSVLPHDAALTDLDHTPLGADGTLNRMWDLYETFKTLLATEAKRSEHWVFAAKLCARKRTALFPVRDSLVRDYLSGGRRHQTGAGWPGDFSVDLQLFAHLMTHPEVLDGLQELEREVPFPVDRHRLRLLDAVLWTRAKFG